MVTMTDASRALGSFLVLALLTGPAFSGIADPDGYSVNERWQQLLDDGREAIRQHDANSTVAIYELAAHVAESFDAGDPRIAESLDYLANAYVRAQRPLEALEPLNRWLEMRRQLSDYRSMATANGLPHAARIFASVGEMGEAVALVRESIEIRESLPGSNPDNMIWDLQLAASWQFGHDLEDAEALMLHALRICERKGKSSDVCAGRILNALGKLYLQHQPPSEKGLEYLRRSLDHELGRPDPHSGLVTYKRHLVITQLNRLERYEEAVDLYRVKLEAQRADLGERHHWLAGTLHGLATSLRLMGDLEASEGPLREALAISEKVWGTDHRITRDVRDQLIATMEELGGTHDLGDATSLELDPPMGSPSEEEINLTIEIERLIATDDLVSAIEVAERGVAVAGATHGEESLGITPALMRLAELLERRGLFEDALAPEERALEIVRLHVAEDDPRHLSARRRIADLLARNLPRDRKSPDTAAQLAEAMKHYERELSIRTSAGESNPELAKLLGLMGGRMLLADPGRSEGYFARAAQMWGDTLGFDSHERFGSLVAMVSCFVGQEHYDEAESLALELLERAAATGRPDGPGVTQLLGNLRTVYRSTGRKDEAEAVLARILASQ